MHGEQRQRVLITGARGFIGRNLKLRLEELGTYEVLEFTRQDDLSVLPKLVSRADAVVHLAGENRPKDPADYEPGNVGLTQALCSAIRQSKRPIPVIFSSSVQAEQNNPYGLSKRAAERALDALSTELGSAVCIYRLPGVFGKWCRPNYNSVVATFCHNIARDLPIQVRDPTASISLVYVDDVVSAFINELQSTATGVRTGAVQPEYTVSLGELASKIEAFKNFRTSLLGERVGAGLTRALYSTYISYLPKEKVMYELPQYRDERGVFVEMLKTIDSGQFSYFTAHPGVTRGGHYHHTKTEKFLVIKGSARFKFRHVLSGETFEVLTSGDRPQVVETVPGWAHDITNIGDEEMVVMLWANEAFDRLHPDTIASKV